MFLPPQSCKHPSASHALAAALEWKCILRWANSGLGWHSRIIDFAQETPIKILFKGSRSQQHNAICISWSSLLIASRCCLCFYQPLGLQIHPHCGSFGPGVVASGPTVAKWCFKMTPGDLSASSEMHSQRRPIVKGVLFRQRINYDAVLFCAFPQSFRPRRGEKKWDENPAKSLYKIRASKKYWFCQHSWWPVPGPSVNGAGRLEIFRLRLCFRAPTRVCALMEQVGIQGTVCCFSDFCTASAGGLQLFNYFVSP